MTAFVGAVEEAEAWSSVGRGRCPSLDAFRALAYTRDWSARVSSCRRLPRILPIHPRHNSGTPPISNSAIVTPAVLPRHCQYAQAAASMTAVDADSTSDMVQQGLLERTTTASEQISWALSLQG